MDGDPIEPIVPQADEERGWSVWVVHKPIEGAWPHVPEGWLKGVETVQDKRQILAAWDPKMWEQVDDGEEVIFINAAIAIRLRPRVEA